MTTPGTMITALTGALGAAATAGPLAQVFSELGLVMAIMGAMGGGARGLSMSLGINALSRGVLIGALVAFGVGVLAPSIISKFTGVEIEDGAGGTVMFLAASSFLIGLFQDKLMARMMREVEKTDA